MSFNKEGFLSFEGVKIESEILDSFSDVFDTANFLNRACHEAKFKIIAHQNDARSLLIAALFFRALTTYAALVKLSRSGMGIDSAKLLRTLIEEIGNLKACVDQPKFHQKYTDSDFCNRRRMLNATLNAKDPEARAILDDVDVDATKKYLDEQIEKFDAKEINFTTICQEIGLEKLHLMVYRLTSSHIHAGPRSIEKIFKINKEGKIVEFDVLPDKDSIPQTILTASLLLSIGFSSMLTYFKIPDDKTDEVKTRLNAMMKKYPFDESI